MDKSWNSIVELVYLVLVTNWKWKIDGGIGINKENRLLSIALAILYSISVNAVEVELKTLLVFRLLSQAQIHFGGLNPETPQNKPMIELVTSS